MTVQILVAPAGADKTEYVLNLAHQAAAGLRATPQVVVPSGVQVRSRRRRLALPTAQTARPECVERRHSRVSASRW